MSPRRILALAATQDTVRPEATAATAAVDPAARSSRTPVAGSSIPLHRQLVGFAAAMNTMESGSDFWTRARSDAGAAKSRQMMVERGFSAEAHDHVDQPVFQESVDKIQ